jgi:hypothetical protein
MSCFCSSLRPGQKVLIVCKMRSAGGSIPSLRRRSTQARIKVISCRMTVCIFPVERSHSKRPRSQSSKGRSHPRPRSALVGLGVQGHQSADSSGAAPIAINAEAN